MTWQPIETAPDGDIKILIYDPRVLNPEDRIRIVLSDASWWRYCVKNGESKPQSWMPLPEPPQ